jgi:hypothetical protein
VAKEFTGHSDKGFSDAVKQALKDVDYGATFAIVQEVTVSPNPGAINFTVRLVQTG